MKLKGYVSIPDDSQIMVSHLRKEHTMLNVFFYCLLLILIVKVISRCVHRDED